jgi:hypothetical protein
MPLRTESQPEQAADAEPGDRPQITVCESRPEKAVFLEAGNTDGWIASDFTVDISR